MTSSSNKPVDRKDIVILVMGPTGSGKSTFINYVLQDHSEDRVDVSDSASSCTSEPRPVYLDSVPPPFDLQGRRLCLLDTPGFDDTYQEDFEILKRIATWLVKSYRQSTLCAVLYFHDMSTRRFTGAAQRNLEIFSRLCGDVAMNKAIIVTTNWGHDSDHDLKSRERELIERHWGPLISKGATVQPFFLNQQSAWDVINAALQHFSRNQEKNTALQIQMEMVDRRKGIEKTSAGKRARAKVRCVVQ